MILEICANSYQSAINAEKVGADRIELCSELAIGGITPSYGLLKKVISELTIPVHILIRPRSGNFTYSDEEFDIMKENITLCKEIGCTGVVSGVLHANNTIDIKRTQELIKLSKPMSFTFHRAFDVVLDSKKAMQQLINMGVDRILTSGQKEKAEQGIDLLIELQSIAEDKIIIMPGSGINVNNAHFFKEAGFKEIHTSASKVIFTNDDSYFGNTQQTISDVSTIKDILKIIRNEE
tara:strand:+ start:11015 stop:11722 length:708 start_codon:yes stop_codon:yes gene_type:complete